MVAVRIVADVVGAVLFIYTLVLFVRLFFDYIPVFNRGWRPQGPVLVLAEIVYTLTDPPIKFFRRLIPPIRFGQIAVDVGFPLTLLVCFVLMSVARAVP